MPHPTDAIQIRPVTTDDVEALRTLRIEALRLHPISFTADLAETESRPPDAWREQIAATLGPTATSAIFVADAGDAGAGARLVGMTGVYTPVQPKLAHVGTIWGVYVRQTYRGGGVGRKLIEACIDWARSKRLVGLRLSAVAHEADENGAARRCYERCGFVAYGVEPHAVLFDGRLYDENLMALTL
jgi:RimJ/RimL family protein N-acetyltransferase